METAQQATDPKAEDALPRQEPLAISSQASDAPADLPPPPPAAPTLLYYAVWLPAPDGRPAGAPIYLPAQGSVGDPNAGFATPPPFPLPPADIAPAPPTAAAHNQRLLVLAIIGCVIAVHLPWIAYLIAVHGCWGTFIDACWQAPVTEALLAEEADPFAETVGDPYLFARIVFLMLRVQAVLSADWAEYSQAMQLSTGLGSFVLTRIVASNGLVTQGREKAIYLVALCFTLFLLLFWAELHLTSDTVHPLLGDDTVLDYISQTLPPDFASYGSVRDGLMQLLQFLRLADALILGACLALPSTQRKPA
jgi:hypothetical protein